MVLCVTLLGNNVNVTGSIICSKKFIPRNYTELTEEDRRFLSQAQYNQTLQWYNSCTDVDFQKFVYMSEGLKVVGCLATPKCLPAGQRLPVIIYNRGGIGEYGKIEASTLQNYFYPMVKAGYVVIGSQYRGNDGGEGKDEMGGSDVNDVLNLLPVIQSLSFVNSSKIFMVGISRGGMMTYLALRKKMPIKTAAVCCGVTDMELFEKLRPDMKKNLEEFFSHDQAVRFAEYEKRSVVKWANEIDVPLILFHAEDDCIVRVSHTLNLVRQLQKYHKKFSSIIYPTGGHLLYNRLPDIFLQTKIWFSQFK